MRWAAATGALNLATRERHAEVPEDMRQVLMDLKREGNNGYPTPKKGVYQAMVELHIGQLQEAWIHKRFRRWLPVGIGLDGLSGENLKKIYR